MLLELLPSLVPQFVQHFDMSLDKGSLGFGIGDEAILHGWNKLKNAPERIGITELILMMDIKH